MTYIQGLFYRSGIAGLAQLKTYWSKNLQKRVKRGSHGARGAPWVSKFGNPFIRKILVLTSAYVRPSVHPSVQTLAEGEGSPKTTRPGEAECNLFL